MSLEISMMPNLEYGIKEADVSKGEDGWYFSELTHYIENNRVERKVLHHLCAFSVEDFERTTFRELEPNLKTRLISDLENQLLGTYYIKEKRDFDVELIDGYLVFYLNGSKIAQITLEKFEQDLIAEPDVKLNAQLEFYGNDKLKHERLTFDERIDLSNKVFEIYENLLEERSIKEAEAEEAKIKAREEKRKNSFLYKLLHSKKKKKAE